MKSVPEAKITSTPVPQVDEMSNSDLHEAQARYEQERKKRLRAEGPAQYVKSTDNVDSYPHEHVANDNNLLQQKHFRVIIVGAGFGGLLFAVRLIKSGFVRETDILIVDTAGGFGGAWWWNRYPGLACDVESYTYMPLLEETKYVPSQKYVSGPELKDYANRIANQWNVSDRALFNTKVNNLTWKDDDGEWTVDITPSGQSATALTSDFVIMATGLLDSAKVPKLEGHETYKGKVFHTSRWDYGYTGGSPTDPTMHKLQDKTIAFVGTGASAIQAVPHLALWAKKVIVFQRTPAAVTARDNSSTDLAWWAEMIRTEGPGWQQKRMENFEAFLSNEHPLPEVDLVDDGWTKMQSLCILVGGPTGLEPDHMARMHQLDFPRQEAVRRRVELTVTDPNTARALQPWYPGWCKRPCFSDTFLPTFNRPNVLLVDTNGTGIRTLTERGIRLEDKEYELDGIIFGTGYSLGSSAGRGDLTVTGRGNRTLQEKQRTGMSSFHGVMTRDFPNLFFPGPYQAGTGANQGYILDQLATHVAHIISEAHKSILESRDPAVTSARFIVEPSSELEQEWTLKVLMRAKALGGVLKCTPGYFNREGLAMSEEEALIAARFSIWGEGIRSFVKEIEDWRQTGLAGLDIQSRETT
jgi:cation diffusion facilitator CzcD-associated flavoprotein CzcO